MELAPYLATIDRIQAVADALPHGDRPCRIFAIATEEAMVAAGLDAYLVLTIDERHVSHAVVEVDGQLHGKSVRLIVDSRFIGWQYKSDLTAIGYTWDPDTSPATGQ